jgi:glutathione reductase (NADPH)
MFTIGGADCYISAIGRIPSTSALNLSATGLSTLPSGHLRVNEKEETDVPGIFALGDVIGRAELTPVAIAAGRKLADRLFGGATHLMEYDFIPTVVFSHPTIGVCGMSEAAAREKYGDSRVKIYKTTFHNLYYTGVIADKSARQKTSMKLVCLDESERVIGLRKCSHPNSSLK